MSKRKPFTAYQVLHAWLETQIGSARAVRPRGYEMPGDSRSTWGATKARAARIVESLPLYRLCQRDLVTWCQAGLKELGLVGEYMASLEEYLSEFPFYASQLEDMVEEKSLNQVVYRDAKSVAKEIGVSEGYLRKVLCTMPTSLPFGSFNVRRKWHIHPMDIPVLQEYFEVVRRR